MRHRIAGRKLGRTTEHRVALLRNLSTELFDKERIKTTLAKAKELRPFAERLVTLSKRETLHSRRLVLRHIHDRAVVAKLFDTLSARYAQRPGGYTRIIKLGPRRGDHSEMAIIELVDSDAATGSSEAPAKARKAKAESGSADKPEKAARKATKKKSTKKTSKKTAKKAGAARKKASGDDGGTADKASTRKTTKAKTSTRRKPAKAEKE